MFKLTKNGKNALASHNILKFSSKIVLLLQDIYEHNAVNKLFIPKTDNQIIKCLLKIEFIEYDEEFKTHELNISKAIIDPNISKLKQEIAQILIKSKKEQHWDNLINLEMVLEKNSLVWFLEDLINSSSDVNQEKYKIILNRVSNLAD